LNYYQLHTDPNVFGYIHYNSQQEMEYYNTFFQEKMFTGKRVINEWEPAIACQLHTVDIGRMLLLGQEYWVITEKVKQELEIEFHSDVEYLPLIKKSKISSKISRVKQLAHRKIFNPIIDSIHTEQQYLLNVLNVKEYNQDLVIPTIIENTPEYEDENAEVNRDNPIFKRKREDQLLLPDTYVSERIKAFFEMYNFTNVQCKPMEEI